MKTKTIAARLSTAFVARLLLLLILTLPAAVQAQFNYTTNNGTITITGYNCAAGAATIPSTINGLPVTIIGDFAFAGCTSLTSVRIPNSVTSIGDRVFSECTELRAITVDALNSVYSSVNGVLFNKSQTTLIQYPGGKSGSYIIPNSVTNVEWFAFLKCTGLTSIEIPNNVSIDEVVAFNGFNGCTNMSVITVDAVNPIYSSVNGVLLNKSQTTLILFPKRHSGSYTIPNSVTSIGGEAFSGCTGLTSVTIPNSVTTIDENAFAGCTSLTSVTIPNSVTSIQSFVFRGCSSLTNVVIPNSITTILTMAFSDCTGLTNVTIPESVTNIVMYAVSFGPTLPGAFNNCTSLATISVDARNPVYSSVDGVLFDKDQMTLLCYPRGKAGSYAVPDGVITIGRFSFDGCIQLTGLTIPDSVTAILPNALPRCPILTSVTMGSGITSIGGGVFANCTFLGGCSPNSSLTAIYFRGNAFSELGEDVFGDLDRLIIYHLPGSTGWGTTFGGRPTAPWLPQIQSSNASFGVRTNQFGFTLSWASDRVIVVEACANLVNPVWSPVGTNTLTGGSSYFSDPQWTNHSTRFYRAVAVTVPSAPSGMALIPAGSFEMGDSFNESFQLPVHSVFVSAFYMDKTEVTNALWDEVKSWSAGKGYAFDYPGDGKAVNHPVQNVNWYDMVKWCNARSEKQGRVAAYYTDAALTQVYKTGQVAPYVKWNAGYRLPTEAEWEKAARGGASGHRFPWSDAETITHSRLNYDSDPLIPYNSYYYSYDVSATRGYHPMYGVGGYPYTSPVGSFAANGYGLYDMAGNVWEWCWDWYDSYSSESQTDPPGPSAGSGRVIRGGSWNSYAFYCRSAYRGYGAPGDRGSNGGFRSVLPPGQP